MTADELCYAGIRELGGLFRRGELSPVDYATDCSAASSASTRASTPT